mgnify:CR=1 FL=1
MIRRGRGQVELPILLEARKAKAEEKAKARGRKAKEEANKEVVLKAKALKGDTWSTPSCMVMF